MNHCEQDKKLSLEVPTSPPSCNPFAQFEGMTAAELEQLSNLDPLDDLDRGMEPQADRPSPHDTQTAARCLLSFPPLPRASTVEAAR